ncbi:MAG TPA: hypothetical protein VK509_11415 [Polyangiales bacterium]|nr:hypothetical protein [Polyangiales bacterium]
MAGSTRLWVTHRVCVLGFVLGCCAVACSRSTVFDGASGVGSGTAGMQPSGGASAAPLPTGSSGRSGGTSGRASGTSGAADMVGSGGAVGSGGTAAPDNPPSRAGRGAPSCREPSVAACVNAGNVNLDCGTYGELLPTSGPCAPAGACCHRSSNIAKAPERCRWEPLELEYRVAFEVPKNHPLTLGDPILVAANTARKDRELESLLWRLRLPRSGGSPGGVGDVIVGPGRYNCDGTYSFYGETAAPRRSGVTEDIARWAPRMSRSTVDADLDQPTRVTLPLASDLVSRERMFMPLLDSDRLTLDVELVSEGFNFTALVVADEAQDCIGSRTATSWVPGGTYEAYVPLLPNDAEAITLISQTYCQLLAFGILPSANKNTSCTLTPRCLPGTASCPWRKLPDSLCPDDAGERKLFPCHLGDRSNVNQEAGYPANIACSSAPPSGPIDPSASAGLGQCCDPFGSSSSLPACNAYRVVYDFTAVAVEITEELTDALQERCSL